jgi:CBS domain containing-hemolysin-like protein
VDQAEAFATVRVADVMTPRADIVGLEISTPLAEVVARFVEVELTRLPVFRETLDDPVGVVHIKDVVKLLAPAANGEIPPWRESVLHRIKRELLYVPASMRTADLLVRMRAQRIHMALVIDEFGGADGLVTLEDILEEVVGEIDDEHDVAEPPDLIERPGGGIEADARTPLEDLEARLGLTLQAADEAEEGADTVGGLVTALAGRLPQRGEVIVHPAGVEFEIIDADPRRIRRLRVRPAPGAGSAVEAAFGVNAPASEVPPSSPSPAARR